MTDKELLELAAKAAGVFLTPEQFAKECPSPWDEEWEPWYNTECNSMIGMQTCYNYEGELSGWAQYEWNPLSDDGDALRLAVKLNIHLAIETESAGVVGAMWDFDESGTAQQIVEEDAPVGGDDYAATRRAIVRAAAEIGRKSPII